MKDKDIVTDILDRVELAVRERLAHDLGFEQTVVDAIAAAIRAQDMPVRRVWGRCDIYVPARSARAVEEAKQQAVSAARRGENIAEVARGTGLDRKTIYRLLRK